MGASFIHDESRGLTCQVVRLDWFVVVGYFAPPEKDQTPCTQGLLVVILTAMPSR
jgi:hypothetical protein